jgi:hypothetical protein
MGVIYEGMAALAIGAAIVWFFWMSYLWLRPKKTFPPTPPV